MSFISPFSQKLPFLSRLLSNGELKHQQIVQLLQHHCSKLRSTKHTQSLHALTITLGSDSPQNTFFNNNIISLYASQGHIHVGRQVFDRMPQRNIVSYNTMITACSRSGNVDQAWKMFSKMRNCGFEPNQFTFVGLLSCDSLDVGRGFVLQGLVIKSGLLDADAFVGTALLGLFGKHSCLDEANRVFEDMPVKNLVTWNSMISLFGQHGFANECMLWFRELMRARMALSEYTFVGVLSGCVSEQELESGEQVHGLVIKFGLEYVVSNANSLINMYAKCSSITSMAEKMFEMIPNRDIVSWNVIIGAFARSDSPEKALDLFCRMYADGILPNKTTFLNALAACTCLNIGTYGELIHGKIVRNAFQSDVVVGSALVNFYAKCSSLDYAHRCFDEIYDKNIISWNSLILGYSNRGCSTSVLLFREMMHLGTRPNEFSFSIVIKSLFGLELKQVHSLVVKMGYHLNDYASSSLITSYARNGHISDALAFVTDANVPLSVVPSNVIAGVYNRIGHYHKTQELFCEVEEPDIVSWNILIAACSRNGDYRAMFELFQHMQIARIPPDHYTYVSLLSVCTKLCNLALGSSLHGFMIKTDFSCCDTFVCNIMIDMYGKCGNVENSVKIFNEMTYKNVISWTALISALGIHGHAQEALERFREMEMLGCAPDGVAFIALLSACRHAGLVKEGMKVFEMMKDKYGIEPQMDHYLLAVDLMVKYGHIKEAQQLIYGMPFPPSASIWRSFLDGCKRQKSIQDLSLDIQI